MKRKATEKEIDYCLKAIQTTIEEIKINTLDKLVMTCQLIITADNIEGCIKVGTSNDSVMNDSLDSLSNPSRVGESPPKPIITP